MVSSPIPVVQTKAWLAYERNLDMLAHLLDLGSREVTLSQSMLAKFNKSFNRAREFAKHADAKNRLKAVEKAVDKLSRVVAKHNARLERLGTVMQWQVVVLVTCVEAYLQDVLEAAASVDPELMSKSEQTAQYQDVVAAKSVEDLASELRRRWAKGWLSDGGPTRWISRLERMGARGYPVGLAARLETIWGVRHVLVHSAGVATVDFLKRHPGAAKAVGDRVRVSVRRSSAFFNTATEFLDPTERFFLARYPLLGVVPTSKASK